MESGTGQKQKKVVSDMLLKWKLKEQIVGFVFDTTSSNTGALSGACKLIEDHLERKFLWRACRHHIYEVHIKHADDAVAGSTSEPGVKLFRRLKAQWNDLEIDMSNLKLVNFPPNSWLWQQGVDILAWAFEHLEKGSWPRGDYKELLELVIVWMGGM